MILMSDLVKDPAYRKFLETKPITPPISRDPNRAKTPPWVVYIQREPAGPWGTKSFWKYSEAFRFFRAWMKRGCYNAALNNKRVGFTPPSRLVRIKGKYVTGSDGEVRQATKMVTWKPKIELTIDQPAHNWCMYCRRPTVFKFYSRHKRLDHVDPFVPRCNLCGASTRIALVPGEKLRVH